MGRRKTRPIQIGNVVIGGDAPIAVQSMIKANLRDIGAALEEIASLEKAGCEIIRVATPDLPSARALKEIKQATKIPIVADIHFDYKVAIEAMRYGIDKIRINPANIGGKDRVEKIASEAKERGIPIRVGVNVGSFPSYKYHHLSPRELVEFCLESIRVMEGVGFYDIVISLKASSIPITVEAYRLMSRLVDYPFHIGVTEAGPLGRGSIKSAIGIGTLLLEGIGDTIRVSLTGPSTEEVRVGYEILRALGLRRGLDLISCPTCGRCEVDLLSIVKEVERRLPPSLPLKIAIMGCVVNGPGEAREADIGLAFGKGVGILFRKGKVVKKIKEIEAMEVLMDEVRAYAEGSIT